MSFVKKKLRKNINEEWVWNLYNSCNKLNKSYLNVNPKKSHKKPSNFTFNSTVQNKTQNKKSLNFWIHWSRNLKLFIKVKSFKKYKKL